MDWLKWQKRSGTLRGCSWQKRARARGGGGGGGGARGVQGVGVDAEVSSGADIAAHVQQRRRRCPQVCAAVKVRLGAERWGGHAGCRHVGLPCRLDVVLATVGACRHSGDNGHERKRAGA